MHLARGTSEGTYIKFRARTLLNMIGRHSGKSQYEWLLTVLSNLTATSVAITRDKQAVFWGSILPRGAAKLGDDAMFTVEINRDLIGLFKRGYTVVEWDQRKQLLRKPLAQHLHAWICSHDRPHAVSVSYVRQLSGSATKNLSKFRQSLRFALSAIKAVGAITDWAIDSSDRVHIKKAPPALDAEVTAE